jgi:hypothetical protein
VKNESRCGKIHEAKKHVLEAEKAVRKIHACSGKAAAFTGTSVP